MRFGTVLVSPGGWNSSPLSTLPCALHSLCSLKGKCVSFWSRPSTFHHVPELDGTFLRRPKEGKGMSLKWYSRTSDRMPSGLQELSVQFCGCGFFWGSFAASHYCKPQPEDRRTKIIQNAENVLGRRTLHMASEDGSRETAQYPTLHRSPRQHNRLFCMLTRRPKQVQTLQLTLK